MGRGPRVKRVHSSTDDTHCSKCLSPLHPDTACMRCLVCGARYWHASSTAVELWLQYRCDAQQRCSDAVESAAMCGSSGRRYGKSGNAWVELTGRPRWFLDELRKDRADWFEWID